MNKIILLLIVCCLGMTTTYSQKDLNDYKYVIVPAKFEFFKEPDKFQLNSLTKFLFEKYGFNAIMVDEPFPSDIRGNNCIELRAYVIEHSAVFKTKLQVELYDCKNELVYKTDIGQTREKEYKKAYKLALRDAMDELEDVNYKYNGKKSQASSEMEVKSIEPIEKEVMVKAEKLIEPEIIKKNNAPAEIIIGTQVVKPMKKEKPLTKDKPNNLMYAQAIDGGYQIVDSTPKVLMTLYNTGKQNTYIVKDQNAIVYKEDGFWYMAISKNGKTETKPINIKF